jgi:hypothetical protein
MQDIDYSKEKEVILIQLGEARGHLLEAKNKIRQASLDFKEIIFFMKGAMLNIKK